MERIKGFSIELELDAIKVDSGLKDLRSSMRQMNSEMRRNMSSFDWGERSLKKYSVQLNGLNKKLELQKKVTESARQHYEKMAKEHGEGSKQAMDAASAYNHEAAQLNNLENHIKKVTKEMQAFKREQEIQSTTLWKTGDALVGFGNKLEGFSKKARTMGKDLTKYVTTPIAGLVTMVGGMGFKRAMDIEQVQMMMEHISDSTEEYEKRMKNVVDLVTDTRFGSAEIGAEYAKFIGASAKDASANLYSEVAMNLASFKSDDQLIPQIGDLFTKSLQSGKIDGQMINQFTNAGVDIIKVLGNKWGMTTEDVRERLKGGSIDIHQVLDELSQGILEGTEGELGVTKAMGGMLEKSGRTLSGQIKNFFAAISQTGERLIKDTGLFDGVKNSLDELREMLKSGELDSVLIPTFRGLSKAMESLVDVARKMFKWFSSLDDSTKEWIGKLVGLSMVLGPILTGLGIFGGAIAKASIGMGKFMKFLAPVTKGFGLFGSTAGKAGASAASTGKSVGLLSRFIAGLTNPVGWVITGIVALTGSIVAAYKKSEPFREALGKTTQLFKDIYNNILDGIGSFDLFKDKNIELSGIMSSLLNGLKAVGNFLAKTFGAILTLAAKKINFFLDVFRVMTGSLGTFVDAWKKLFSGDFQGALEAFSKAFKDIFSGLVEIASNIFNPIKEKFINFTSNLVSVVGNWFVGIKDKIWDGIKSIGTFIKEKTIEWSVSFLVWANDLPNKVVTKLGDLKESLVTWISEKATDIKDSLVTWVDSFKDKTVEITNNTIDWVKNLPKTIGSAIGKGKGIFVDWLEDQQKQNEEFYGELGDKIKDWIKDKSKDVVSGFFSWKERIEKFFKSIPKNIGKYSEKWWTTFSTKFLDKKDEIKERFGEWKENVVEFFKSIPGVIKKRVSDWWKEVKQNFFDKKKEIKKSFADWKNGIVDWFKSMPKTIGEQTSTFATSFKDGIKAKTKEVVKGFSDWWKGIKDWFSNLGKKKEVEDAGKKIVKNIKKGAEDQKDDLMSKIGSFILDLPKYILMVAGVLFLSVGRELIKRIGKGIESAKEHIPEMFSRIWNKTKDIFAKKSKEIYENFKNSFIGRIIKKIIEFASDFRRNISNLWERIKVNFREKIIEIFNNLRNSFIGRIITNIINFATNFRKNISDMWTRVKKSFSDKVNEIRTMISNSFVGRMLNSVRNLKTNFVNLAKAMWSGVKKQFNNIVDGAKGLPKRIGDGIRSARDKATNGMKSVGNKLIEWAGKPFNKVVRGVNWITGKLGIKTDIDEWDWRGAQYAKGTPKWGHPGGMAMIGEEGRELVKLPDGRSFISPDHHTILDLPKGSHVIPNNPTEQIIRGNLTHIPGYAKGTGLWERIKGLGRAIKGGFASITDDIWQHASNPSKLVNQMMDKISIAKGLAQIPKEIASAGLSYLKTKPIEFVKEQFKKTEEQGGNLTKPNFGGRFRFTSGYGMRWGKLHGGVDYAAPIGTPIPSQSGGVVSYAANGWNGGFGNLVKVRQGIYEHFYAHMSRILTRAGQQVGKGTILGLVGNTGHSTGPHVHYEIRKNGQRLNPHAVGNFNGFKTGGLINSPMMAMLAEGGHPEFVIPTDPKRRTDAMKLLALAAKKIGADSGSFVRPSGIPDSGKSAADELLEATLEQNEYLKQNNELLLRLLEKNTDLYMGTEKVGGMLDSDQSRRIKLTGRVAIE